MPLLTEIATIKFGKQVAADTKKGMYELSNKMFRKETSIANKLRTSVAVGSEANLGTITLPSTESNGIYASWCSELERKPMFDLYESQPLNQIKNDDKKEFQEFLLEMRHKEWLKEVENKMKELGFKK